MLPYETLARKRRGEPLSEPEIQDLVQGAVSGSWSDAQLGAFLMAGVIHGLSLEETRALTRAMLDSGEQWGLGREVPRLGDKHSTGGVGDKASLVIAPLLAQHGLPVVMLVGRGLGHTGGTADKLEAIPGMNLDLDRRRCLELLGEVGVAIGIATEGIAPADRKLYALRDQTATVESLGFITASILSKKLATGAGALALDVKTGSGAFLPGLEEADELAQLLVTTANDLGCPASAWVSDMSQPLGEWVGHGAEVTEALSCLSGEGPSDLTELSIALAREVATLHGEELPRERLQATLGSGAAREGFLAWARAQGAEPQWATTPMLELAPVEMVIEAEAGGWLASVSCRRLGLLMIQAGGGRARSGVEIDHGISLWYRARLGARVEKGDELARLYLRTADAVLADAFRDCFTIGERPVDPPPLLHRRVSR